MLFKAQYVLRRIDMFGGARPALIGVYTPSICVFGFIFSYCVAFCFFVFLLFPSQGIMPGMCPGVG